MQQVLKKEMDSGLNSEINAIKIETWIRDRCERVLKYYSFACFFFFSSQMPKNFGSWKQSENDHFNQLEQVFP